VCGSVCVSMCKRVLLYKLFLVQNFNVVFCVHTQLLSGIVEYLSGLHPSTKYRSTLKISPSLALGVNVADQLIISSTTP